MSKFWVRTIIVLAATAFLSIGGWGLCNISENSSKIEVLSEQNKSQKETNCENRRFLIRIDEKVTGIYRFLIEDRK